ncbi:uncharacterized protein EI90DRAFT_3016408 [Cantharellus anzutake]|uniref:uncharacterized protein n=1 Tax=Cantharellus anzutake TaxID=1750568 RepID=UPI0019045D47|nr:uncharacterized protein EI90DRAFT_3016408 [Cantharellus anzutake]KAF8331414.1 hypothetical protein EI90DRAFT_3016408 [Cantharellus anzutake]
MRYNFTFEPDRQASVTRYRLLVVPVHQTNHDIKTKGQLKALSKGQAVRQSAKASQNLRVPQRSSARTDASSQNICERKSKLRLLRRVGFFWSRCGSQGGSNHPFVRMSMLCLIEPIGLGGRNSRRNTANWLVESEVKHPMFIPLFVVANMSPKNSSIQNVPSNLDDWGDTLLRSLQAQGLPTVVTVAADSSSTTPSSSFKKDRSPIMKSLLSFIQYFFPSQHRVHDLGPVCIPSENSLLSSLHQNECLNALRSLCEGLPANARWRDGRMRLVADANEGYGSIPSLSWEPNLQKTGAAEHDDGEPRGTLSVIGTIRGAPLSANHLIHIPNYDDFLIAISSTQRGKKATTNSQEPEELTILAQLSSTTLSDSTRLGSGRNIDKVATSSPTTDILSTLDHSNRLATPSPPPRVSELEATQYYWGLHSNPWLIARTGGPWYPPSGPEAYPRAKELRILGEHELFDVWEDDLALKVHNILNQNQVNWSSTEIVRIAYLDEPDGNLILWIGVYSTPTRLSYDVGIEVAVQCKRLLLDYSIQGVDVELRESDFVQFAGPALLKPTDIIDPTAIVREPFTTTLGMNICAESTPWAEGTVGFFMAVNGIDKLYGVTARHVLFPRAENKDFERINDSLPRHNVQLLSEAAFQEHLALIQQEIDSQNIIIASQENRMAGVAGREDAESRAIHEDAGDEKRKAERRKQRLTTFLQEIKRQWSSPKNRILGHVKFSPKIVAGAGNPEQQFTQDIAVFEVESSKVTPSHFPGNFIDLGTKYSDVELTRKMYPNPVNSHHFTWPGNRLLKLWGTIPMEEMRKPTMLDQNGDPCITVLKQGRTTNVTVGKVLRVIAYVRKYFTEHDIAMSKELAVIPLDKESGPFSAKGDSGAVVVDGMGRIAGILTGGGGATDCSDVTYVTPIHFVLEVIHQCKALANAFIKNAQPT